jgi:hypothetical protein
MKKDRSVVFSALLAACAVLTAGQSFVLAQSEIYATGFESPTFIAGSPLLGVDGWNPAIPPFLNPGAATITQDAKKSGKQSVEVWGGDLLGSEGITAPYDAVGSYRKPLEYTVTEANPIVRLQVDMLLESDQPRTADDFFTMTIAARSGKGETLGELGLSSAGQAVGYGFNVDAGTPAVFDAGIKLNRWHKLQIELDYSGETTTVSYFLDGELLGVMPTTSTSDVLLRGALVTYAMPDDEDSARANFTARFDNFKVSVHGAEAHDE